MLLLLILLCAGAVSHAERSFAIANDRFVKDGQPIRLFSGSVHYPRIHPAYWRDRLRRIRALGLNTIQFLVPWSFHEPRSGEYTFEGWANLPQYLDIAQQEGLLVLLRPGPYTCGEWDNGGLPSWLPTSRMEGGARMHIRSDDPVYLSHVQRWWRVLFSRVRPYLYENGGPIAMVQMENEYGFCGPKYGLERSQRYMRALVRMAREGLGDTVLLYTTDPPNLLEQGSLPGDEVYSVVDFGTAWQHADGPFESQRAYNLPGKSPPFNSEFYTGWLTHWGESSSIANMSMTGLTAMFSEMLEYGNRTGSFNLYMAQGGTNFGFYAGANTAGQQYQPHITSYDYDSPISEAGDYGQPGYGGPNKFEIIRRLLQEHTKETLPQVPPRPKVVAFGDVALTRYSPLLDNLGVLSPGSGMVVQEPQVMEEYGQRWGLILYRTELPANALLRDAVLDFVEPVHDYAKVFINGHLVGYTERSNPSPVKLPAFHPHLGATKEEGAQQQEGGSFSSSSSSSRCSWASCSSSSGGVLVLDVLVQAQGHDNFGCNGWDLKGLTSRRVLLDGTPLPGPWRVFNMELPDVDADIDWRTTKQQQGQGQGQQYDQRQQHQGLNQGQEGEQPSAAAAAAAGRMPVLAQDARGPVLYKGDFHVPEGFTASAGNNSGHLPDTFLFTPGWTKGMAWVNGFNLGWYWPVAGPQLTLYVPGPLLVEGRNQIILMEMDAAPEQTKVSLIDTPKYTPAPPAAPGALKTVRGHQDVGVVMAAAA